MTDSNSPPTVPLAKKPRIGPLPSTNSELLSRLNAFLPQLESANEDLVKAEREGRISEKVIEDVDEDGEHIEMDLACGILEEKRPKRRTGDADGDILLEKSDESESEDDSDGEEGAEGDVLGKLLGTAGSGKPRIEVVVQDNEAPEVEGKGKKEKEPQEQISKPKNEGGDLEPICLAPRRFL